MKDKEKWFCRFLRLEVVEEVGQLFVLLFWGSIEGVEMIEFLIMVWRCGFCTPPAGPMCC